MVRTTARAEWLTRRVRRRAVGWRRTSTGAGMPSTLRSCTDDVLARDRDMVNLRPVVGKNATERTDYCGASVVSKHSRKVGSDPPSWILTVHSTGNCKSKA